MSPVKGKKIASLLLITGLLLLGGCGSTKNDSSPFNEDSHSADWLPAGHKAAAQANATACQECHGDDYQGGISKVSCNQCHLGGYTDVHPTAWGTSVALNHGPYVQSNGNSACANASCHGTSLTGVDQSGPSCTSCHLGGVDSVHPTDWGTAIDQNHGPYVQSNGTSACANAACHGGALSGGTGGGPSCTSCHLGGIDSIHPTNWGTPIALNHAPYVEVNGTSSCANAACHGTDLKGSTGPSCTLCHLGDATSVHPSDWTPPAFANHAQFVRINGVTACQNNYCHGSSLTGVVNSGPSCTSCHLGGVYAVHPAIFSIPTVTLPGHAIYVLNTVSDSSCANAACHGLNLQGVPDSGPSCASCHDLLQ